MVVYRMYIQKKTVVYWKSYSLEIKLILADRGFTIQNSASLYCAVVKLPPFTRGKKQLSRVEVDSARDFSRL